MIINPVWKDDCLAKLAKSIRDNDVFEITTSYDTAAKWIIMILDARGITFKVLNLGAGVKKITTDVSVCPKCHGTGKC